VGTLAALLTVGAAACGSGAPAAQSGKSPRQAVLDAVSTTESAGSASITVAVSITGTPKIGAAASGQPLDLSITGQGAYSFAQRTGQFSVNVPATGRSSATTIQFRQIGDDLYLSTPSLSTLDGGKPWVHVSVSQYEQRQGQSTGPAGALSTGDPTQVLQLLHQLGGSVTQVGAAQIDGASTTEYQGQIDLTGTTTGSTVVSQQFAQALGLQNIPVDVWVDDAGRARQVETSFSVLGLAIKAQERLGSFGTAVSVSAPPADQVADGSGLLQSGRLGNILSLG
jgi:hypothetical protein